MTKPVLNPRDAALAATAVEFTTTLFLGRGEFDKIPSTSLEDARAAAAILKAAHPGCSREPMVYAISSGGSSIFIPANYNPTEPEMNTYAKKFNALRAAKAAGYDADAVYITTNAGGTFSWFLKADAAPAEAAPAEEAAAADPVPAFIKASMRKLTAMAETIEGGTAEDKAALAEEAKAAAAAKPAKPAKVKLVKPAADAKPATGKRAAVLEAAQRGEMPSPPDFSAETHARFRKKLAEIVAFADAGDLKGLKSIEINPASSSRKAMAKYRDLAIIAIEARKAVKKAA